MTAHDAIVAFEGIGKRYGQTTVLHDLSLAVAPGDFMVVYGPPASGKSVLMRLLMGLEEPTAGRIVLRGQDVRSVPAADRRIGYVPQSFALYPHLSVHDNIAYPLELAGIARRESEPIVRHAAEMLRIDDLLGKRPDQLSGGQKQRVAIARGIAKPSDLYVLDDPLAGLDFKLREQLVDDLRRLQQDSRATFLYTTSDAIEALTLADHLAILDGGTIVEDGEPQRLYVEPGRDRTMALVGFPPANFLAGVVDGADGGAVCRTALFAFPVRLAAGAGGDRVTVGIRPEALRLGEDAAGAGRSGEALRLEARVVLREDLGGEEIVYLDCGGTALTSLDRHPASANGRPDVLDERVAVRADPRDLVLFRHGTGERIGRGVVGAGGDG